MSPFNAAKATFALNAGLWFRLGRLAIVAPSSRHAAGSGAENPPNSTVQISQATSELGIVADGDELNELKAKIVAWQKYYTKHPMEEDEDGYADYVKRMSWYEEKLKEIELQLLAIDSGVDPYATKIESGVASNAANEE